MRQDTDCITSWVGWGEVPGSWLYKSKRNTVIIVKQVHSQMNSNDPK